MSDPGSRVKPGLEATCERIVPLQWTLTHYDPRLPPVFSTPAMIGLMEMAASLALTPALEPDTISVGTRIEVDHLRAAPVGAKVSAHARLVEISGRSLIFEVTARNGEDVIGRGRIFRAIVNRTRFSERAASRSRA